MSFPVRPAARKDWAWHFSTNICLPIGCPRALPQRTKPVKLIGASIGAWRFAAVCCNDPRAALAALAKAYSEQKYPKKVDAKFVSAYARDLTDSLFNGREQELLSNRHYQLNVLVVRGKGILSREARGRTRPDLRWPQWPTQ